MTNTVTLDHVERLAEQLPLPAQLQMVARIMQRLSASLFSAAKSAKTSESYAERIEAFLKLSESQAAETIGEVDSAEGIRAVREDRAVWLQCY